MDPRYHVILTDSIITDVKHCLLQTHDRLLSISHRPSTIESTNPNEVDILKDNDFEKLLQNAEATRSNVSYNNNTCQTLDNEIEEYLKEPRLKNSSNILHYWTIKKDKMPKLFDLSEIILAIPPTQVSVERLFSALKFILSPHRSSTKPDIIQHILLIRLNMPKLPQAGT